MGIEAMFYCEEIATQAKIGLHANQRLKEAYERSDYIDIWGSIQLILVAAGNVSKLLWPIEKKYKQRGKKLRLLLGISDNNLLKDRKFRNHFEHYDSHLDAWIEQHKPRTYRSWAINPALDGIYAKAHRGYNAFNHTVEFLNETLDLNAVIKELDAVIERCKPYTIAAH